MKTINSISGGKTSSYIAVHFPADYEVFSLVCIDDKDCAPVDKSLIYYVNAKLEKFIPEYGEFISTAEDDATLKAMMDLEQYLGKEITWVRGRSYDDILNNKNSFGGTPTRLPSWARRYCTLEMKLLPIFKWWFDNVGEKVKMRIGFRFDEYDRMEKFFNNSENKGGFRIPVSCSTKGMRKQKFELFDWRFCTMPLIKHGITKPVIEDYWNKNGYVGGNLFEQRRKIEFPIISNCIGCFHKKPDTLSIMAAMHENKMKWFAKQEELGKGTWLDSKIKYETIIEHSKNWIPEMLKESGAVCDSGGCHD